MVGAYLFFSYFKEKAKGIAEKLKEGLDVTQLLKYSFNNYLLDVCCGPDIVLSDGDSYVKIKILSLHMESFSLIGCRIANNKHVSGRVENYGLKKLNRVRKLENKKKIEVQQVENI